MFAMIISFVIWSMISPIAPQLTKLYGLSIFDKSILVATPVLLGSILRIPLGILTDRFGGRKIYTLLMLYLVIPLIGISYAHSFLSLVVWEVLLGVAGTSFAVGIGYVSSWYPVEQQGFVLGITALGNIGTAVAGFTIPSLFLHMGFASMSRMLVIPVLIMAALLWFLTRDPNHEERVTKPIPKNRSIALPNVWMSSKLWILSVFYFITFGGFVAFGNYLPTLLQGQFSFSPIDAGLRASAFVVLATALRPVGGYLADRIAPQRLLIISFAVIMIAAVLFSLGIGSILWTTVAALLISTMLGIGNGAVFKLVPLYFPHNTGKATGIIGAFGGIGGFFPPLVLGAIKQSTGSYSMGLLFLAVACAIALMFAIRSNRWQMELN
jgi:NNP family nitrate/nitrite transporter-like MFS transporter